jgi:type IV pilus assembly protein PilA
VVAIISILAAVAVPIYQDLIVRSKVSEAIIAATSAKSLISEAYLSDGLAGVTAASSIWNGKPALEKSSKYVKDIQIGNLGPGIIVVYIEANPGNGLPPSLDGLTLTLSPNVQKQAPSDAVQGTMDWACASIDHKMADDRGLQNVVAGTLPTKFAPSECK